METYPLYKYDFRSKAMGYHLDVWEDLLKHFNLPPDTVQIDILLAPAVEKPLRE